MSFPCIMPNAIAPITTTKRDCRSSSPECNAGVSPAISAIIITGMNTAIVKSSPDILGGTPVFAGTRVPVQPLIENLEAGDSIDDFLDGFPTVSRKQVAAFLEEARDLMWHGRPRP